MKKKIKKGAKFEIKKDGYKSVVVIYDEDGYVVEERYMSAHKAQDYFENFRYKCTEWKSKGHKWEEEEEKRVRMTWGDGYESALGADKLAFDEDRATRHDTIVEEWQTRIKKVEYEVFGRKINGYPGRRKLVPTGNVRYSEWETFRKFETSSHKEDTSQVGRGWLNIL